MPRSQNGLGFLCRSSRRSGWQNFRARRPRDRASSKKRDPAKRLTHCRRAGSHRAGTNARVRTRDLFGLVVAGSCAEAQKCPRRHSAVATVHAQWRPVHPPKSFVRAQFFARTESGVGYDVDAQQVRRQLRHPSLLSFDVKQDIGRSWEKFASVCR